MRWLRPLLLAACVGSGTLAGQEPQDLVVRKLSFEGNRSIEQQVLRSAISTTNSSWFATTWGVRWFGLGEKRYFNEQEFRRDVVRLEVLYRRSGYPHVEIDTLIRREPQNIYVTFKITEGAPIVVRSIEIIGTDSLRDWLQRRVRLDLPLRPGDPFNRYAMQATADSITHRLKDRGYPDARVYTAFESDRDAGVATIQLDVVPGNRAVFGEVSVVGAQRIEPSLVRNLLVARPGRRYSQDELFQSQRNLYGSDLFRFATVNIDSAEYEPGMDSVPLVVQVNEGRRRRIRGGLGYGTEDCFRGSLGWTSRNFLGSNGRILELTSRISKVGVGDPFDWGLADNICSTSRDDPIGSARVNYNLGASLRRPAFLSSNNTLSVSVYTERRSEFKVYLRRETGSTVTLSRESPRRRNPLSLSYNLSYGRTEATDASFCASFNACTEDVVDLLRQNRVLATITGVASFPRTNNPIDPSRGSLKSMEVTVSSRLLGSASFQQFTRLVADASWYRPLNRSVVLSWRVRGGVIFSPTVDVATQRGNFIPPEQRFYAGGPNDVRGFERNELGPVVYVVSSGHVDSTGGVIDPDRVQVSPTGGNTLAVANLELRVPSPILSSRLRLAAYVDAGGAWQRGATSSDPVIRVTPGVGIRLNTPLGPARLDVAYNPYKLQRGPLFQADADGNLFPVDGQPDYVLDRDGRVTYHFAVGQAF